MNKTMKRIFCIGLSLALLLGSVPVTVFSTTDTTDYLVDELLATLAEATPTEAETAKGAALTDADVPDNEDDEDNEVATAGLVVASRQAPPVDQKSPVVHDDSDGIYSHRNWEPEPNLPLLGEFTPFATNDFQLFGATRATGELGNHLGEMTIAAVEVLLLGEHQARFRGQVGRGHTVYEGASGNWYTTARAAALMDGRAFHLQTTIAASVIADADYEEFLASLTFTYGDLPLEAWLGGAHFNLDTIADESQGGRFIHWQADDLIDNGDGTYTILSLVEFRSPYPTANPEIPNIPWDGYRGFNQQGFSNAMRHVIGTFDLALSSNITGADVKIASLPINLNLYDDFHLWSEVEHWAKALKAEAGATSVINGRHVDVVSLGQSHGGRDIWRIVIAESAQAVNDYFTYTRPRITSNVADLQALRQEVNAGVHHRIPLYFHNIHPDEVTGVDAQLVMVEELLRQDYITFETVREEDTRGLVSEPIWGASSPRQDGVNSVTRIPLTSRDDTQTVTISVEEALEHFIFVFVPTNNPDGHDGMLRGNQYGFDLNRDAAYQTQIENRIIVQDVLHWNPLAMLEFHGHVAHMLIEPTTGPHNPNYEYDLLNPVMLEAAHVMGRASIAGAYYRYVIPAEHMTHGWDDGGPMYMPIFLMQFGILGFTLEIPHTNQDSLDANVAMGWAFVDHAMARFTELFDNKLEYNRRGMTNADYAHLVDDFFINPFVEPDHPDRVLGRPRQAGRSFFPDYWVIPADDLNQWNRLEAYNMLAKLARHEITIERTTSKITHDAISLPAGTYIIDMRQARRGYVNTMLETGYDASIFTTMYAEITMNFPDLRGFDAIAIWEPGLFDDVTDVVTTITPLTTNLAPGSSAYLTIRNSNQDVTRLINQLLSAGVDVHMLNSYSQAGLIGDFIVERSALTATNLAGLFIETNSLNTIPDDAQLIIRPRIAFASNFPGAMQGLHTPGPYILRDLGFDYIWVGSNEHLASLTPGEDFNIIVNHNVGWSNVATIANNYQIPVVAIQTTAALAATSDLFANRGATYDVIAASREGTFDASFSATSLITGHYERVSGAYLIGTTAFSQIPTGATPLITIADGDFTDIFRGGWWQGEQNQANVAGRVVAFTGLSNEAVPVTVFGTNIFNRAHSQVYHNLFATAVFAHTAKITEQARPFVIATTSNHDEHRLAVTLDFIASETAGSEAVITEQFVKVSTMPHAEVFNPETALSDGWQVYIEPILINPSEQFVHWFAVNSYAISAQGNLNFSAVLPAGEGEPSPLLGHTITFDPTGGVVTPTSQQTNAAGTLASLPIPVRAGYEFIGWFSDLAMGEQITTQTVFNARTTIFASWQTITSAPTPNQPDANLDGEQSLPQTGASSASIALSVTGVLLLVAGVVIGLKKQDEVN